MRADEQALDLDALAVALARWLDEAPGAGASLRARVDAYERVRRSFAACLARGRREERPGRGTGGV